MTNCMWGKESSASPYACAPPRDFLNCSKGKSCVRHKRSRLIPQENFRNASPLPPTLERTGRVRGQALEHSFVNDFMRSSKH